MIKNQENIEIPKLQARKREKLLLKDDSSVTSYTSKMPMAPR